MLRTSERSGWSAACAVAALVLLLVPVPAHALDPTKDLPQYVHDVWEIEDGLPQNSIHDIAQDAEGYLWFATVEGLVRFDGVRFNVYSKANVDALVSDEMRSLYRDENDVLWIGSYGSGLIRLAQGVFTSFGPSDGLEETRVWAVGGHPNAGIWLGTHQGLYSYRRGAFRRYTTEEGLAGDDVRCIHVDGDGTVWAGTMKGLSRLRDGVFTTYTTEHGLAHEKVTSLARDRHGRLWIGTHAGLNVLEDGAFKLWTTRDGLVHDIVLGIYEDRSGALWFGTEGGLSRYLDGTFASFTKEQGLSQDIVCSFHEDDEGSLWIGTETGGLNRFRDGYFIPYTHHKGLPSDLIWSFYEDRRGRLMIGSADGLIEFRDGAFTLHRNGTGGARNTITSLYEGRDGTFWVGTKGDGLFTFRDGVFGSFPGQEELASDFIHSLQEDTRGNLWIGTRDGLRRLADGKVTRFTTEDGLAGDVVRYIEAAPDGALWIGTGSGLSHYRDGRFTTYTTEDGLSDNKVFSIHTDADGTLWLGTYGGGLNRFRDGRFHHVSTREGLYDNVVYVILEDVEGNLWMSGNKGVFRVSKREFDAFVRGEIAAVQSPHYGVADGMKSRECNGGLQPAGFRTRDGTMWFPTIKGAVAVMPSRRRANMVVPPVHVEALVADGRELASTEEQTLGPGVRRLEIHYTALSFAVPRKVRFRYMLEGYDTNWVDAGTRRVAYYTNLEPGDYTFRVQACNEDDVWNEAGASLAFRKTPYFYETTWFLAALAALMLVSLFALYRRRIRRMERRERELEALVAQRTEELKEASLRDSLTGLRNRRFISEVVQPETRIFAERKAYLREHGGPRQVHPMESHLGLFLLDIDHFKQVNDTLGHDAGDRVLEQFSSLLTESIRKDDVVVRWGGEEFLVVLRHTSYDFIAQYAHSIREAVARHDFIVSEHSRRVVHKTCSIGYVPFPFFSESPDLVSFEQAIALADLGLYQAKRHGRNLAVGLRPADQIPARDELARMLTSLDYGIRNGFLRIHSGDTVPRTAGVGTGTAGRPLR